MGSPDHVQRSLPSYALVIPTLNERESLSALLGRIDGVPVIVVDDGSDDGTQEVVSDHPNAVLIERGRRMGLVSAYLDGMRSALESGANYEYFAVMDGDGQHDPSLASDMVRFASERGADLVIGSRYVPGGDPGGFGPLRRTISRVANTLFRLSFDAGVRDATSGYRVYSRRAVQYLLGHPPRNGGHAGQVEIVEILHSAGMRIVEFPMKFGRRRSGDSKLGAGEIWRYFLFVLTRGNLWKYALVGLSGVAVNEGLLALLSSRLGYPIAADAVAVESSILWNFLLNEFWTFRGRRLRRDVRGVLRRAYVHNAASLAGLAINLGVFALLSLLGVEILLANLVGIVVAFAFRYLMSSGVVWLNEHGR
jgi:dolichol-phosphate mannosyltransferase